MPPICTSFLHSTLPIITQQEIVDKKEDDPHEQKYLYKVYNSCIYTKLGELSVFFSVISAQTEMREHKRRLSVDSTLTTVKPIHGLNSSMNAEP